MPDSVLQKSIMRRVYFIWGVRQLANPLFLKIAVLAVFLWQVKEAVFVRQVFANMVNYEITELFNFLSAAFLNTDVVVQVATLGIGILSVLLVRDIVAAQGKSFVFVRNT